MELCLWSCLRRVSNSSKPLNLKEKKNFQYSECNKENKANSIITVEFGINSFIVRNPLMK